MVTQAAPGFLRQFYWSLRRPRPSGERWAAARHRLLVLPRFAATAARATRQLRRRDGRSLVAIALLEHMGDIVAAEPVARLARRQFPDARIVWITRAPFASIPASYPQVDDVVVVGCMTEWILLRFLRLFDVVWDLHINARDCQHCRVPLMKPGVTLDIGNYLAHGNLLDVACVCAGLPRLTDGPVLTPPAAAVTAVTTLALPVRYIVVHGSASVATRDWPAEKWTDLLARLQAVDPSLWAIEVGLHPLAIREDGARRRALCGRLSILETAEVIRRASLFIGIDSGPAHLANAVGTPGVILLGAYGGFASYLPYSGGYATGAMADIVRATGPAAEVPVANVFDAALQRIRS